MGWLEGVLTGYAGRHYDILKEKREEAEKAAQREQQVMSTLLSSEYPEIRDYAAAGMLDLANPRRRSGGMAGWMGEVDKGPYLDMIRRAKTHIEGDPQYAEDQLAGNPFSALNGTGGLPPRETGGTAPPTPSIPTGAGSVAPTGSAAQPSTNLVEGGPATPPTPPPPPPTASFLPGANAQAGQNVSPPSASFMPGVPAAAGDPRGDRPNVSFAPPQPPSGVAGAAGGAAAAAGAAPVPGAPPQPLAGPPLSVSAGPPPPPGQVGVGLSGATVTPVGRPAPVRSARTQLPGIFPTASDLARNKQQGDILGEVQGWQLLYRQMGDPDWQKKGIEAVLASKRSATGGGLREGNIRQTPDGSWVQDLYDPYSGKVVGPIPSIGPAAGGSVQEKEALAFELYGREGEDPRATIRRISPTAMGQVNAELIHRRAVQAAELALARAEAMADAPLAAQAKSQLIETLNTKWQSLQKPVRDTARSFEEMKVGLRRFQEGDKAGASEMIRVAFERILDPTSVVREGEYARQVLGLSAFQRLQGWWQGIKDGGGQIPFEQLEGIVETTRQFMTTLQGWNDIERGRIEDRAASHKIDPGLIFGGGLRNPAPVVPPAAGGGAAGATADPNAAPGVVDWNSPLRYDPITRKMVPAS